MRVLWITPSFFPLVGGLEVYVENVVASLTNLCHVGLVTKTGQWFPGDEPISHFTVSEMQPHGFKARWQIAEELAQITLRFAPEVVHLGGAEVAVHRWAIPDSIPVFATVHGNDLTLAKSTSVNPDHVTRLVEGLNGCEHIFAVSQHTAALCREWGITTPTTVVTAGVDTDCFCPWPAIGEQARLDFRMPQDIPILLTVSRLVPRKGHLCVLEAIRRLPFPAHWVVVGDGPCRDELLKAAATFAIEDRVTVWGAVSDDDLPGLYNACDIFVFTPEERRFADGRVDSEGFGLVYLEASACGKPVIGSRISGCKDAVIDGATGILVQPGDPDQLSKAIEFLVSSPDSATALGAGGLMFVQASGGWQRLARQTFEKYQEILHPNAEAVEPPPLRIPF
jgi:phosphatidylinositol alpha-1,6-mannosyltransferase